MVHFLHLALEPDINDNDLAASHNSENEQVIIMPGDCLEMGEDTDSSPAVQNHIYSTNVALRQFR